MCGIVCYTGTQKAYPILIEGLKRLEYRGYDSAGLAIQGDGDVDYFRAVGRIVELENKTSDKKIIGTSGIAHTRWATHGEPTEMNAHPHRDMHENIFIIHNGIIENFLTLKKKLAKSGIEFRSETDTEILAHLISTNYEGDLSEAVRKTMSQVEGTFGLAVIHRHVPGEIVVNAENFKNSLDRNLRSSLPCRFWKDSMEFRRCRNHWVITLVLPTPLTRCLVRSCQFPIA